MAHKASRMIKLETLMDGTQNSLKNFRARRVFISELADQKEHFAKCYNTIPVSDNWIFYESMGGKRMMDNPLALFRQIHGDKRFKDFVHVWVVTRYDTIPTELKSVSNMLFVTRNTSAYMQAITKSKYIVCNSTFPVYVVPKPEQKYLNTWHGIAYKGIGRSEQSPLGPRSTVDNMLQATHILTSCDYMTQKQLLGFSMKGVYSGELAEAGYPRIDMTLNASAADKKRLYSDLGLDPDKQVVLYAPTWRGVMEDRKFDVDTLQKDLAALAGLDANVIFMGHHLMIENIKGVDLGSLIIPPPSQNTNELLSIVDVLITDYSSIFFDFLVTNKPIIHYVYDYDEYKRERGLGLELDELPGEVVRTKKELIATARNLLATPYKPTRQYARARKRFCPHEDGRVSKRVAEWFIKGNSKGVNIVPKDKRPSIVFWGGALNNTQHALEYLEKLKAVVKRGDKNVVLVVARSIMKQPEIMTIINDLGETVTVIARAHDTMIGTKTEKVAKRLMESGVRGTGRIPMLRQAYDRLYRREYQRMFGGARFDEIVLYPKCSRFWKELVKYAAD